MKYIKYNHIKAFADAFNPLLKKVRKIAKENNGEITSDYFTEEELELLPDDGDELSLKVAFAIIDDLGRTFAYSVAQDIMDIINVLDPE